MARILRLFARNVAIALGIICGMALTVIGIIAAGHVADGMFGPTGMSVTIIAGGVLAVAAIATACQISEGRA